MRFDAQGMFWHDEPHQRGANRIARVMPEIPNTGWLPPRDWPNLRGADVIAIDTETKDPELLVRGPGWARHKGHIVGVSLAAGNSAWYFPVRHEVEPEHNVDPDNLRRYLQDMLGDPRQIKVGANLIYDIGWLREEGVRVRGELCDVQFAEALLDERQTVALDDLAERYLGEHKETSLLYQWCSDYYGGTADGKQRANIYRAPPRLVGPYAEQDARLPLRVMFAQYGALMKEGLYELFRLECELIYLLVEMRFQGVRVDLSRAEQVYGQLGEEAALAQRKLRELVGFDVNTNAPDSLAKAFDAVGVPYSRTAPTKNKPEGNPSFTKGFLEELDHPIGDVINEIRLCEKLRGTFVKGYILDSHVNGRVHCQFHPLRGDENGTRSGRLSSSDPNLQNIPSRNKKLAPLIRGMFVPDDGDTYWTRTDYSQIEYRGLVHFAVGPGADEARQRYHADPTTDYHEYVAQMIHRLAGLELPRSLTKNVNFGLVYGMGIPKLIRYLHLTQQKGKKVFEAYHDGVPFVKATMEATEAEVTELGYITTILGRRSRFDLWEPAGKGRERLPGLPYRLAVQQYGLVKRAYTHKALNRRLQGTAADLMKVAMALAWRNGVFDAIGVPRVTVHDELGFSDSGDPALRPAYREMARIMETALPFRVPIRAEWERGPDWGHLEDYDLAA